MTGNPSIGFIGAGQMATALAKGWLATGFIDCTRAAASDPLDSARSRFAAVTGIHTTTSNAEVAERSELLVLAIKPQTMPVVLAELRPVMNPNSLVMSIAAGVTLTTLEEGLGDLPLIRVMPNMPCLVGQSASAFTPNSRAQAVHIEIVKILLESVGIAVMLPEKLLDAVTGLSGSGPAYAFLMIEALADGGVKMGLPRDVAIKLAAQTVRGAGAMVMETGSHPAILKDAVASPGGTTIAGLHELEKAGVRAALMLAVEVGTKQARQLADSSSAASSSKDST